MEMNNDQWFTNGWTATMDDYHNACVQKCQGYAWMHFNAASFWGKVWMCLTIPATVLNVLVGSAGLATLGTIADDPLWYLFLTIFVINIVVGMVNAVSALLEPNTTAYRHRELASEFVKLARKLQTELITEPVNRIDCSDFTEMTNIEYENLMKSDIPVPDYIIRKFEKSIDDTVALPEMILDSGMKRNIFSSGMARARTKSITEISVPENKFHIPLEKLQPLEKLPSSDSSNGSSVSNNNGESNVKFNEIPKNGVTSNPSTSRVSKPKKKVSSAWMNAYCKIQERKNAPLSPNYHINHSMSGEAENDYV